MRRCFIGVLLLASCAAPRPYLEVALFQKALERMKQAQAQKHAPKLYYKAIESYQKARRYLMRKDNSEAKLLFKKARLYAEKAELRSIQKKSNKEQIW